MYGRKRSPGFKSADTTGESARRVPPAAFEHRAAQPGDAGLDPEHELRSADGRRPFDRGPGATRARLPLARLVHLAW